MSPTTKRSTALVAAAIAATTPATALAGPAGSGERPVKSTEEHCVIEVTGVEETGEFITADPVCYPTLTEALATAGAAGSDTSRRLLGAAGSERAAAAAGVIGIHWDGANRTGSSITISGADCGGGYVNLSASWTNRISSTRNYCEAVVFWDGFDKTGSWEQTNTGSINLGALNNASNSISYGS